MKTKLALVIALIVAVAFASCKQSTSPGSTTITYTATQTGGTDGVTDSTGIVFTFSGSVDSLNLTAADITVGGVAGKGTGALTGSGASRTIPVTVSATGTATVTIAKTGITAGTTDVAVYKGVTLTGIMADYTPGTAIFPGGLLHTLRDGLTVTATYSDGTSRVLDMEDYDLDGTLAEGTCVITVRYLGKEDTFTVTVAAAHTHIWGAWIQTKAPTCIEPGEIRRECTATSPPHPETDVGAPIDLVNGHEWGNRVEVTPATFTSNGAETYTCNLCHATDNRVITAQPVMNLGDYNAALSEIRGGGDNKSYTITIGGDITGIAPMRTGAQIFPNNGFGTGTGITVTLKSSGGPYTLDTANTNGGMFHVGSGKTIIIDGDLTLRGRRAGVGGHTGNHSNPIIHIQENGSLELKNGTITGNTSTSNGGGVWVNGAGTFTMSGGTISDNITGSFGGGVYINQEGTFTMTAGEISGNTSSSYGGGVAMQATTNYGFFTMLGGNISGNTSSSNGGGVWANSGTLRIVTGTIHGSDAGIGLQNTATTNGAALYRGSGTAQRGTFSIPGDITSTWTRTADLTTTDNTINVVNGDIVP